MGKKTKQIVKELRDQRQLPVSEPKPKQAIEPYHQQSDFLSQSFKQRLIEFMNLNDEIFTLKQKQQGDDVSGKIKENKLRIAKRVEQAASAILRDELESLEEWIGLQKDKVEDQINKINKAYEQNRNSLMSTRSFSEEEVVNQLTNIQKKVEEKQKIYDHYDELLQKSRAVYGSK